MAEPVASKRAERSRARSVSRDRTRSTPPRDQDRLSAPRDQNRSSLRAKVLRWYDSNQRDLPWRRTRDPYAIWVSEVMLQQTRVETVVRYYDRFLARFPTTTALAAAAEDEVLAVWSGLGYYRRARLLHQGVREVVTRYHGLVPQDPIERRALPGIGRYTAGAIGSIAFDRAEPIVDGNVARVLSRLCGIDTPLGRADTERALWSEAEAWAQGPRPGALNQALMELGATVCSPRAPQCALCPLRDACVALSDGAIDRLPVSRIKKAPLAASWVALLATPDDGRIWLNRASEGLFGGLWNLPMAEGNGRKQAVALMEALGLAGVLASRASRSIEHVLTHRRMRVQLWRVATTARADHDMLRCVPVHTLDTLGISRLTLKLLAAAEAAPPPTRGKRAKSVRSVGR